MIFLMSDVKMNAPIKKPNPVFQSTQVLATNVMIEQAIWIDISQPILVVLEMIVLQDA